MNPLHADQFTFLILSRLILLRTRNVPDKVVGKIKTHFEFNNIFSENRAVYKITLKIL